MGRDTVMDDVSVATTDDTNKPRLKSITSYTKNDLDKLAETHGVAVPAKTNKQALYDLLKTRLASKA